MWSVWTAPTVLSCATGLPRRRCFLYDTNTGAYTHLDDPNVAPGGSPVMQITGINNAGEIAGFYADPTGAQHGFRATPAVPEPALLALLGLGVIGLMVRPRRRTA